MIELLISMVLGLIIVGASLQAFLTVKKMILLQQGMSRIQENARIASILLHEQIATAGNFGCNRLGEDLILNVPPGIDANTFGLNSRKGLEGADISKFKPEIKKRVKRKVASSDVLWIKKVRDLHLLANKKVRSAIKEGTIMVISDCIQADILSHQQNESEDVFIGKYAEHAEMGILSSVLLYVGNTYRINANGFPINALYATDINGRTLELIEGVEDFKVLYGNGNQQISYWKDNSLPAGEKIVKVKISLLLTSIEDALSNPRAYQIDGEKYLPKDRLMRMWWTYEFPIG